MKPFLIFLTTTVLCMGCNESSKQPSSSDLSRKINRFVPATISADTSRLSSGDRKVLSKLVAAARIMDTLYLTQVWSGNLPLLQKLEADPSPLGREQLQYFLLNMGPWSLLDGKTAFLQGVPPVEPPEANFYPEDMTKEEFTRWVSHLSPAAQKEATGFFTLIRRDPQGNLISVPYSEAYRGLLSRASTLLNEAAALAENPTLRTFLEKRAEAFLTNDYYASDVAWMDLNSPLEPTIGPYEVYLDDLFNYKAAFEAFITIRNDTETANLARYSSYLQEIENHLPIPDRWKNRKLGTLAPIRVVDEVAIGGEARAGVQTAAFNLPNDERVVAEKGSKRVMLLNVQRAKFEKILKPIAALTIDTSQQHLVVFDAFFTHILAHELMHGLGPHTIVVGGKKTTVRQAMKEIGSALEEAKADVAGLFALQYLIDKGVVPKEMEQQMYVTYLASAFRSLRFGITEAHGRGMALQVNFFLNQGAFHYDESTGRFSVDFKHAADAARRLTGEIMTLQARGDYHDARAMLNRLATIDRPVAHTLEKLRALPVDIRPVFQGQQEEP